MGSPTPGRRILLTSYELPGWGGAATAHYTLFAQLQERGFDVSYLNILHRRDQTKLSQLLGADAGNPRKLPRVTTVVVDDPLYAPNSEVKAAILESAPDGILAFGWLAARIVVSAKTNVPLVLYTAGSAGVKKLLAAGEIDDFLDLARSVRLGVRFPWPAKAEEEAYKLADYIIPHSAQIRWLLETFFPSVSGKVHSRDAWIADTLVQEVSPHQDLIRPFSDRDIDVVFVANDWHRLEKGFSILEKLLVRLEGYNVHVLGLTPRTLEGARVHGLLADRRGVFSILGRSKVFVSTSLFDSAPGVLFEAALLGANVVASPNCGNHELCPEQTLVPDSRVGAYVEAIERGISCYHAPRMAPFLGGRSEVIETMDSFLSC